MKVYLALDKDGEPYRPPHTRYSKTHGGTARLYTTPGRARMALGRRKGYIIVELDTINGVVVSP